MPLNHSVNSKGNCRPQFNGAAMIAIRNFNVVKIAITILAVLAVFTFKHMYHIKSRFSLDHLKQKKAAASCHSRN